MPYNINNQINCRLGTPPPRHYADSDDEVDLSRDEEIDEEFVELISGINDYDRLETIHDEEEDNGHFSKSRFVWRKMRYILERDHDEVGAELRNRVEGLNYEQVSDLYEELSQPENTTTEAQRSYVFRRLMELDESDEEMEG